MALREEDSMEEEDEKKMSTGKPCPMTKANVFSFLTWQWVQPLITTGNKKTLEVLIIMLLRTPIILSFQQPRTTQFSTIKCTSGFTCCFVVALVIALMLFWCCFDDVLMVCGLAGRGFVRPNSG